jgi:hypothetical protein
LIHLFKSNLGNPSSKKAQRYEFNKRAAAGVMRQCGPFVSLKQTEGFFVLFRACVDCYFGCFAFSHAGLFCREERTPNGFLNFDMFTAGALHTLI